MVTKKTKEKLYNEEKKSEHIIVNWNLSEASSNVILRAIRASLFESPPNEIPPIRRRKKQDKMKKKLMNEQIKFYQCMF